jgi:hypothetical protein
MRWLSGERFLAVLADASPTGVKDADPAYWVLRLDALRLANRPDQFDEAAIDYCVTYEVSPPSWERARCQVRIGGSGLSTQSPPLSQVSDVATTFLESSIEDQPGGNHVQVATVDLSGQLVGDIGTTLQQLDGQLGTASMVTVSCQRLIRVDFVAAGDLLNWVLSKRSENRSITFADSHRLVALFFGAMGINENASVRVRNLWTRGLRQASAGHPCERRRCDRPPSHLRSLMEPTFHGTTILSASAARRRLSGGHRR